MKCGLVLFLILLINTTFGQTDSANAPYLKNQKIPDFIISTSPDSSLFSNKNLKKDLNTVFILFSPDCEFCQHETQDLIKNIQKFKKTQIVMISFMSQKLINDFYKKYKIADQHIITMGKDSKYFFLKYFRLRIAPSTFVYDRKGNFKIAYHHIVDMKTLLKQLP